MKVKQKSVRSFEFTLESEDEGGSLLEYVAQNREILQNFLLVVNGPLSAEILETLETEGLRVITDSNGLVSKGRESRPLARKPAESEKEIAVPVVSNTFHAPIRSGTHLECEEDVIIFGRINSGAKVHAKKNAIIFSLIDGTVEAEGDYLIAKNVGKGHLFFHNEAVDPGRLKARLHKITMGESGLVYEEL